MSTTKGNSILPLYIKYLLIIFAVLSFSVCRAQKSVRIDIVNKPYQIQPHYYSGKQMLTIKNISEVDTSAFKPKFEKRPRSRVPYWSTFHINLKKGFSINYLEFHFPVVDRGIVYVPILNGGYKQDTIGMAHPIKKVADMDQTSALVIDATTIDFSKPFYFENTPLFTFGINLFNEKAYITGHNKKPQSLYANYRQQQLEQSNSNFESDLLYGMLFISFVFVLIFYIIHRKRYFFSYALYLFSVVTVYSSWTPYFYNIYSKYDNYIYLYLAEVFQISASFWYLLFINQFVAMKHYHPKLNRFYQVLIYGHLPFLIIYVTIIWKNPYYTGFDNLTNLPIYIAGILNFATIIYMFIKRRSIHTTIVFAGSVLLVIGRLYSAEIADKLIIMYTITIETLLFMGVISYLDMKNFKKAVESDKLKQINNFKNKFFINISHELRTPLTLISTPIDRKLEDKTLSKKDRSSFEMIQRNNTRLLNLVDQLLDLSKVETRSVKLQIRKGNVLNLISAIAESFTYMADQKNLAYQKNINNNKSNSWFDQGILEKITLNLLSNAIKYTPDGGSIICNTNIEAGILTIEVKNTGKGLSGEQSKKVFDRFYQVDENQQGTGIGLALVKELVILHKGNISVESNPDNWTTFKVNLPVSIKDFNDQEIETNTVIQKPGSTPITGTAILSESDQDQEEESPILLIVEDSTDLRILLKNIFEDEYHIIMAKNGKEGVEFALKHIPDLIISDIMMPVKDGISLTKELKNDQRTSHIPIILLTAKIGEEHELTSIETGADDYITKPFNSKILTSKVGKLIALRQKLRDKYSRELVFKPKEITITPVDEQFLTRVQDILDQKLVDPSFSIEEFSTLIGMSRMQLHRKLKALTDLSPSDFLRVQRLKLAAQLLKEPKIRISEVGYSVGFNSMSYFTKCFKEMFHCTPSEYVKK